MRTLLEYFDDIDYARALVTFVEDEEYLSNPFVQILDEKVRSDDIPLEYGYLVRWEAIWGDIARVVMGVVGVPTEEERSEVYSLLSDLQGLKA